jgi:hypothetical protein
MPGPQGNQFTLQDTALWDLMPVIMDGENKAGFHDPIASPLTLTGEGRSSLLTMLADSEEANPDVWRALPGFHWHAPVVKSKGGTEVLAVNVNRRGRFGPTPLIVTKAAGNGKVLFMGIDSAWRWRRGARIPIRPGRALRPSQTTGATVGSRLSFVGCDYCSMQVPTRPQLFPLVGALTREDSDSGGPITKSSNDSHAL